MTRQHRKASRSEHWASLCLTVAAGVLLSACAAVTTVPAQDAVKQRANERWQALVAHNFDKAYTFHTEAFRALVTTDAYRARFGGAVKWVGAEVANVDCASADQCKLRIKIDYRPVMAGASGGNVSTYIDETWLSDNGVWSIFQPVRN